MTDTKLQIRIEEGKKEFWKEFADAHGMGLSELIRRGVEAYINSGPGRDSSVYIPREPAKVVKEELDTVYTNREDGLDTVYTEEEKWSGPVFKDDKLNKFIYEED